MAASKQSSPGVRIVKFGVPILLIIGVLAVIGIQISLRAAGFAVAALFGLSLFTDQIDEFGFAFPLSLTAILLVLSQLLPAGITGLFDPVTAIINSTLGVNIRSLNPAQLGVFAFILITIIWFIDIRFTSQLRNESGRPTARRPAAIANRIRARFEVLIEDYVTIGAIIALTVVSAFTILLQGTGFFAQDVLAQAGQAPVVAAALLTDFVAYLSLGGVVPVIGNLPIIRQVFEVMGSLGPVSFGLLAGLLLALALAARDQ